MERVKKFLKFGAIVLPILLLTTALSAPAALADSGSGTDSETCPVMDNVTVTVENLAGSEASGAVSDALSENDVKLLRSQLVEDGYTSKVDNAEAVEVTVSENGTVISQVTGVRIPFKTHADGVEAGITYTDNGTAERAFATVSGPAGVLEEPMNILEENARYQAIVENLEDQGYTVHEENAQVAKGYIPADYASVPGCIEGDVWHTAFVSVEVVKNGQVKNIAALVCIDEGKVLAVADGYWDCVVECAAHFALEIGICYYPCWAAVVAPNPTTWAACAACVGIPAVACLVACTL